MVKDNFVAAVVQSSQPEKEAQLSVLKAVRQIMFNELGLNRIGIQKMIGEEIKNCMKSYLGQIDRTFEEAIAESISNYIHTTYRGSIYSNRQELQKKILKMAEDEVKSLVVQEVRTILANGLKIDINTK